MQNGWPRRRILTMTAGAFAGLALPRLGHGQTLPLTPECAGEARPTASQTEGPYFKPRSPRLSDLRQGGLTGTTMQLTGFVLTTDCRPVANALVDLWHADATGDYDNRGFRGRGHHFTDAQGRYSFTTIRPARYSGRTPHFHVKVQAAKGPVLTTQLYFPDEPGNARDRLFNPALLVRPASGADARFDFVVARG
jgi:protocatechuate 3,4-dioxygenase beta subunit